MTNEEFWQQVFLTYLAKSMVDALSASMAADEAVRKLQVRWPDPKEPVFK